MIAWLSLAFAAPTDPELAVQAITEASWRRASVAEVLAASDLDDRDVMLARIRALGRLRSPDALGPLRALRAEPDPEVQIAVAFALGLTPGAAGEIRGWLAKTPAVTGFPERMRAEYGLRWQLIEALGRAGDGTDVGRLTGLLAEGWPYDDAAARALLRLHRRGIDVRISRGALADQVLEGDPRTMETAAQALVRIGVDGMPTAILDPLVRAAEVGQTSGIRSALVRALILGLPDDSPHRTSIQRFAGWDLPLVRGAAVQADTEWRLRREAADPAVVLAPGPTDIGGLLTHREPWIRLPAIGALAWRTRTPAIETWIAQSPPVEAALAIRASGLQDDVKAEDPALPWVIRAAYLAGSDDVPLLVRTAIGRQDGWADKLDLPGLRSAAVDRLQALKVDRATLMPLLASSDPAVREAAFGLMEGRPDRALIEEMVLTLRVEASGEVLRAGFVRLLDFHRQDRRSVTAERYLVSAMNRGAAHSSPAVRDAALALAKALGQTIEVPPPDLRVRELILPDGTVTSTTGDLPRLLEVGLITGATVTTTQGSFEVRLDPEIAPFAVHNFVQLARAGFYTGTLWHRIVPGFVAQGGCPRGDGWGGPGWLLVDEVSDEPFVDGALGMARGDRDTGGSQWFVATGAARFLDGDYTWFGEVTSGMHVVRQLGPADRITAIRVHRKGAEE